MFAREGFESISLASTVPLPLPIPESSDDGLDPNEFLSNHKGKVAPVAKSRNQTASPITIERLDVTPTLLTADLFLNPSRLSDSQDFPSMIDSFHFTNTESMYKLTQKESPLEYLQTNLDSLQSELRKKIRLHKTALENGDDCLRVRIEISTTFDRLSENCYLLNEIYSRELAFTESLLNNFEKWDRKRTKVLRRIQSIKSEDNKYGLKLAGLLNTRAGIDNEISDLEAKIEALKSTRTAVTNEISETSSVLESKSAKYVNIFRDLEQQGRGAISDYLYSSGLPEKDLEMLLRTEEVEAVFVYKADTLAEDKPAPVNKKPVPTVAKSTVDNVLPPDANSMGIQALEVPDEELVITPVSAYEKGYARGTEQLELVKKGLNQLVHAVFDTSKRTSSSRVDDILNTITEKIDLVPIVELMSYKMEAVEDMILKSSRMSASFHDQSVVWKDTTTVLESNESLLFRLLSEATPPTAGVVDTLKLSLMHLQSSFEKHKSSKYLGILLHQECKAVAGALEQLTHDSSYLDSLPDIESMSLEMSIHGKIGGSKLNTRITSTGYNPAIFAPLLQAKAILPTVKKSRYVTTSKGVKKE